MNPINVVVADSSPFVCELLKTYLESVPTIQVVGIASQGQEVIDLVNTTKPDVITLGLELPDMDGIEVLKSIQQSQATPAIIISGVNSHTTSIMLEAMNLGAVDIVFKFCPGVDSEPETLRQEIIHKVQVAVQGKTNKTVSEAVDIAPGEVIAASDLNAQAQEAEAIEMTTKVEKTQRDCHLEPERLIVVGASTGGPIAIQQILEKLPDDFPGAMLLVQHLPPEYTRVLVEQLNQQVSFKVKEAGDGMLLERATAYVTPGNQHIAVDETGHIKCFASEEINGHRPIINVAMQSAAKIYGDKVCGVLLTGIGTDGIDGLAAIRQEGGKTFVQSLETCAVRSLPQRAIESGLADNIATPEQIAFLLIEECEAAEVKAAPQSNKIVIF